MPNTCCHLSLLPSDFPVLAVTPAEQKATAGVFRHLLAVSFGCTLGASKENAKPSIISFQQELKATDVVCIVQKNRIIATQGIHSHLSIAAATAPSRMMP